MALMNALASRSWVVGAEVGSRVSLSMGLMGADSDGADDIIAGVNRYGGDCIVGVEIPEIRINGSLMPAALQEFWVVCWVIQ